MYCGEAGHLRNACPSKPRLAASRPVSHNSAALSSWPPKPSIGSNNVSPILTELPFVVEVHASNTGLGAVLSKRRGSPAQTAFRGVAALVRGCYSLLYRLYRPQEPRVPTQRKETEPQTGSLLAVLYPIPLHSHLSSRFQEHQGRRSITSVRPQAHITRSQDNSGPRPHRRPHSVGCGDRDCAD